MQHSHKNHIIWNHSLRLTAAIFLFVSMLVQVQVVFACDYMDKSVQRTCCCEDHADEACNKTGGCEQNKVTDTCCDVHVSLSTSVSVASLSQKHNPEILVAEAQAPSPFISPSPSITDAPESPFTPLYSSIDTSWYNAANIYLLTHRFRE